MGSDDLVCVRVEFEDLCRDACVDVGLLFRVELCEVRLRVLESGFEFSG